MSNPTEQLDLARRVHELKTDPEVFAAVLADRKTHEIRFNDRGFQVGDELLLRETAHSGTEMAARPDIPLIYTDRAVRRTVSHIQTGYGLTDGWCILSFARRAQPEGEAPQAEAGVYAPYGDDAAVDLFAAAMQSKMAASRAKGRSGWNDPEDCPAERLQSMLIEHLAKGDPVDVANFCMMLWNRNESTAPAAQHAESGAPAAGSDWNGVIDLIADELEAKSNLNEISQFTALCEEFDRRGAALAAQSQGAHADVGQLTKERDGWKEEAEHQKMRCEAAYRSVEMLRDYERADFWIWQGDNTDYLSSMASSKVVLIRADQLRAALAAKAEAPAPVEAYMTVLGGGEPFGLHFHRAKAEAELREWEGASEVVSLVRAQQAAAPGSLPDLLPPLGIRTDRDMLNYLMVAFDNEIGTCGGCGRSEPTKHMDSAGFLREYLATAPSAPGTPEAPKGGAL